MIVGDWIRGGTIPGSLIQSYVKRMKGRGGNAHEARTNRNRGENRRGGNNFANGHGTAQLLQSVDAVAQIKTDRAVVGTGAVVVRLGGDENARKEQRKQQQSRPQPR